jgi:serine O-acetyltransferase
MATDVRLKEGLPEVTEALMATYAECGRASHLGHTPLPSREAVRGILADLHEVLYPGFGRRQNLHIGNVEFYVGDLIDGLHDKLTEQIARALRHELCAESPHVDYEALAQRKAIELLRCLPELRSVLESDVQAAFEGDPAARGHHEIIFCYPGLEAITVYRIAHELHRLGVPFIPRMMTESAHARTGIDIHPGARIGRSFFIDHGTGVVVGETCVIGEYVKLYQGVTLGARSFQTDPDGNLVRGTKRHPTLGNRVVIYANATVLGGDTVIGDNVVIGSNVWLMESVPPNTVVTLEKPNLRKKGPPVAGEQPIMYHI